MDVPCTPLGISRNRTIEMVTFRDRPLQRMEPNEETRLQPIRMVPDRQSPLDPFFRAASEIKLEFTEIRAAFERLEHHQERSLRPAFGDIGDSLREVNAITIAIGSKMRAVSQRIGGLRLPAGDPPDRVRVVDSLREKLLSAYRAFSREYQISEQVFSVNLQKTLNTQPPPIDVPLIDFGGNQQQTQVERESTDQAIRDLARRSETIRDLFADIAQIVTDQGTLIDRIDIALQAAVVNVEDSHRNVREASEYQRRSRLWICIIVLVLLIVILFVLAMAR
jgi:syntaxin 16